VPQDQELEYALDINSTNVEIIEERRPKKDWQSIGNPIFCKVSYGPTNPLKQF
jgi:hypothetical protein